MKLGTNDIGSVYLGTNAVQKVYLGTNEVWSSGDPDYLAFYARVINAGGSLTSTEQAATEQLVLDLKDYGIWTKMKAVYPMVGASAAACAQNLKSSSFTGTFTATGWTFASTGVTPNGTSAYMDTGLNSSTQITNNNNHLSYYSRTNVANDNYSEIGVTNPGPTFLPLNALQLRTVANNFALRFYDYTLGQTLNVGNSNSQGFFIGNRTSNIVLNAWKNATKLGTTTYTNSLDITTVNYTMYIGALNAAGSPIQFTARQCAFASIGDGLTDTEASNFYTAVQAFQTTLNRQV